MDFCCISCRSFEAAALFSALYLNCWIVYLEIDIRKFSKLVAKFLTNRQIFLPITPMNKYSIKLAVYDLSNGMAKQLSMQFLGEMIEAIYHTGIIAYGQEYFYGGGINVGTIGEYAASFGLKPKFIDLGETEVTQEIFEMFLSEISHRFTAQTYDLLAHNCNHFTNECSQFLLGNGIPHEIVDLPNRFLSTPMGAMLRPMLDNMQNRMASSGHRIPFQPSSSSSSIQQQQPTFEEVLTQLQSELSQEFILSQDSSAAVKMILNFNRHNSPTLNQLKESFEFKQPIQWQLYIHELLSLLQSSESKSSILFILRLACLDASSHDELISSLLALPLVTNSDIILVLSCLSNAVSHLKDDFYNETTDFGLRWLSHENNQISQMAAVLLFNLTCRRRQKSGNWVNLIIFQACLDGLTDTTNDMTLRRRVNLAVLHASREGVELFNQVSSKPAVLNHASDAFVTKFGLLFELI